MNRVFALRAELLEFLKSHNHQHSKHFEDSSFILTLAFLADIFGALNQLSCQMQGGGIKVVEAEEKTNAFQRKLKLWRQRLENHNFANFPLLDEVVSNGSAISIEVSFNELQGLLPVFTEHSQKLQRLFENCFPERMQYPAWVRRPFSYDTTTADVNSLYTDDIIELQESEVKKRDFNTTNLQTFWCHQIEGYPLIAKVALEILMPFVTTYLCEHAFSILVYVKAKKRNRLACKNGMRIAVSETKPRISQSRG